jgi:hypothetical protein
MFFDWHITTPANTPESDKLITELPLVSGLVIKAEVKFHPGGAGLLFCQVKDALHQVWPSNQDGHFNTEDETVSFGAEYPLEAEPFKLYAHTWNTDDTYEHEIDLRIEVRTRDLGL